MSTLTVSVDNPTITAPGLTTQSFTVTVVNGSNVTATLALSSGSSPDFTMSPASEQVKAGKTATLVVTGRASGTSPSLATVQATPSGGGAPVSAHLQLTPTNPLTIDAATNFGTIAPGGQSVRMVTVKNLADEAASLSIPPGPFTVPGAYGSLFPSSLISVPVTYTQGSTSTDSATASVTVGPWSASDALTGVCATTPAPPVDVEEPVETDTNADGTKTTYQAYYVHTPNPDSVFNLGRQRSSRVMVDGFGIDTVGYGYVNVAQDMGIVAGGNVGVQALVGDVNIQAAQDASYNGGDILIGGQGNAYLLGASGVLIGSISNSPTRNDGTSATATDMMPNEVGVGAAKGHVNAAATFFGTLDAAVGLAFTVYNGWETVVATKEGEVEPKSAAWYLKWLGVIGGLAGVTVSLVDSASSGSTSNNPSAPPNVKGPGTPGVTIYGHAGLLMGTPGFGSVYAAAGLAIASAYPVIMGVDVAVLAITDLSLASVKGEAKLTGKQTVVRGESKVSVESPTEVRIKATTPLVGKTQIDLQPLGIEAKSEGPAGTHKSSLDVMQHKVVAKSTDQVQGATTELTLEPKEVTLDAGLDGKITLVAGGWKMEISKDGITLAQSTTKTGPGLTLKSDKAILKSSPALMLKLEPEAMQMQAGNRVAMAISPGIIEQKGRVLSGG
jgi:hypothetical protein